MTKSLIRLYNREDETALTGKCFFLVLDGTYEDLSESELDFILNKIGSMGWQRYTSYAVATCDDITEQDIFWSEIMNYNMQEVNINIERVNVIAKYRLPECITG